jgi:hypothetical protein
MRTGGERLRHSCGRIMAAVTGYLRRAQELGDKKKRLILLLEGVRRDLNI